MKDFSLTDFYQIGRNAVRLFPDNARKCLQPQTFRVLQLSNEVEIGTPNLGVVPTDTNTPFFWSRLWEQKRTNPNNLTYEYPLFTMNVLGYKDSGRFSGSSFLRLYTIQLTVLDLYRKDCVDGTKRDCTSRPKNQIYIDTGIILDSILRYFEGSVIATTSLNDNESVYYLPWLEQKEIEGLSFTPQRTLSTLFNVHNRDIEFQFVDRDGDGLFGTQCTIIFPTSNCFTVDFKESLTEYGVVGFEAGKC